MYCRKRERRYHRHRRDYYDNPVRGFTSLFRRPSTQIAILAIVGLVIYLLLQAGNSNSNNAANSSPNEIDVSETFSKYQNGALLLDVRTLDEWNQFHVPNSILVPLEQLAARVNELPTDKDVVVICNSGDCSRQGSEILFNAGFTHVASMSGGLEEWRASGYPVEP